MKRESTVYPIHKSKCDKLKSDTWDWIAVKRNEELGRCRFTFEKDHIYIDDILVKKKYRKQNVGSLLIKELEEHARSAGFSEIRGSATAYEGADQKEALRAWWETRGYQFRFYSSQPKHIGQFHKVIFQLGEPDVESIAKARAGNFSQSQIL